jgi:hypothetical protein
VTVGRTRGNVRFIAAFGRDNGFVAFQLRAQERKPAPALALDRF